jgi:phosphotriesterase-related protein
LDPDFETNYPGRWDEVERTEDAVEKLQELPVRGIDTIVDMTVLGLGRDIRRVLRLAHRTTVNIIAATGLYTFGDLPMFFRTRGPGQIMGGDDPLTDLFVSDITVGIAGSEVKAAVLKCATDQAGVTEGVERVLRSVARAHLSTGTLISTHTHAGTRRGLDQQRIFREEGVDLTRVVIGHSGDSTDEHYLRALMDAGSTIGMDRFGFEVMLPFQQRVETVVSLCALGYADRMVLSHDCPCFTHSFYPSFRRERLPQWRYTHVPDEVIPALREHGVSESQLDQMLIHNPRRLLEGKLA